MCGIAGIYNLNGACTIEDQKRVKFMMKLQKNRGPDSYGISLSKNKKLILGNNRLGIVGINEEIPLPYRKKDSKHLLAFNGEIFNYKHINQIFASKNIITRTNTDTEILFEYLRNFGADSMSNLDGMWAFSFYDNDNDTLTLSRDILGERHIFYAIENNKLIFASTAKAVMSALENPEFDYPSSIYSFIFGSTKQGSTLIRGIKKLLPGHHLIIKNNKLHINNYYNLMPQKYFDFIINNNEEKIIEKYIELLSSSLKIRLPIEANYCFSLSGGIDSSLNCLIASKLLNKDFDAFFMNGNQNLIENEMSEMKASSLVAEHLNINLKSFEFECEESSQNLLNLSKNCFDGCIDDGISSFSILANKVKNYGKKVIILSDGPDEFLGGYNIELLLRKIDLNKINLKNVDNNKSSKFEPYNLFPFRTRVAHQIHDLRSINQIYNEKYTSNMYESYSSLPYCYLDFQKKCKDISSLRALNYASSSIPEYYNLRSDRAFMDNAVEVRQPFLEKNLVEFMIALPSYFRFKNENTTKFILRKIIEKDLPVSISKRSKYGYANHLWDMKNVKKNLKIEEQISDSNFFNHEIFNETFKNFLLNSNCHYGIKWSALTLMNSENEINKIKKDSQDFLNQDHTF